MSRLLTAFMLFACLAAGPTTKPAASIKLEGKLDKTPATAADVAVAVRVSCKEGSHEILLGSMPQVFGIYVLGPWGPVQPDLTKVRPENWMHQEHSAASRIVITPNRPFDATLRLADYFPVTDASVFREGRYQVNVKFFDIGIGMPRPVDSGAITFDLPPATQPAR